MIKTKLFTLLIAFYIGSFDLEAQNLLVLNGGVYGSSTDFANIGIYDFSQNQYTHIDDIFTNSAQDLIIENDRYVYVAAQDSIIKYDMNTLTRVAANEFGSVSTKKLGLYNDKLLVGNFYGSANNNLRIFDKNTLVFIDSVSDLSHSAQNFVIKGDYAYVAQNLTSSNYTDSLGHLAVVDLTTFNVVQRDTLGANGEGISGLVLVGDTIYAIMDNGVGISEYTISSSSVSNYLLTEGINNSDETISRKGNSSQWYVKFGSNIGLYDFTTRTIVNDSIFSIPDAYTFAVDTVNTRFYTTYIDWFNQPSSNLGEVFDNTGTLLGNFPVNFSPEIINILYNNNSSNIYSDAKKTSTPAVFAPNPIHTNTTIIAKEPIESVFIFDVEGKRIKQVALNQNLAQAAKIDMSTFNSGIYLFQINFENGNVQSHKLIKE